MIATLKGDTEREKAETGVFVTLQPPTEPMRQEALSAGIYTLEHFSDQQDPPIQILRIDELLAGANVAYPRGGRWRRSGRRRSRAWYNSFVDQVFSSVGRAPALQAGGDGFESPSLHQFWIRVSLFISRPQN